jgi:hypothetical protein
MSWQLHNVLAYGLRLSFIRYKLMRNNDLM